MVASAEDSKRAWNPSLRIKPETVDYSTQYPWMFGVLCILIATGIHPLSDYPSKYEENHKILYRSHHVQSLPDPTKYPPVFMKLVKKTILCDPVRRPTLQQILTVFKRDPKILSLMTGNRLPVHKGNKRASLPATISKDLFDVELASQNQTSGKMLSDTSGAVATNPLLSDTYGAVATPPAGILSDTSGAAATPPMLSDTCAAVDTTPVWVLSDTSGTIATPPVLSDTSAAVATPPVLADTCGAVATPPVLSDTSGAVATPPVLSDTSGAVATLPVGHFTNTNLDHYHVTPLPTDQPLPIIAHASTKSEFRSTNRHSRSHDQSEMSHVTPPKHADPSIPGNGASETVGSKDTWYAFTNNTTSTSQSSSVAATEYKVPLKKTCTKTQETTRLLKRYGSLGDFSDNFWWSDHPRGLVRSVHSMGSISHLPTSRPEQERKHERVRGRTDFLTPLTLASSEGDINLLQEFPYQRLTHSPHVNSSQQVSPICRGEGDLEHLIHSSSPDVNYRVRVPGNTDPVAQNTDLLVQNTDTLLQNTDPLVQYTDLLIKNTESLVNSNPGIRSIAAQSVSTGTGMPIQASTIENDANPETTHLPSLGNLCSDVFLHIPMLKGNISGVVQLHHMENSATITGLDTSLSGAKAIASRVSISVETQASVMDVSSVEVIEKDGSVDVILGQGGQGESEEHERNAVFSPDLSTSGSHPEGSDKELWSGVLGLSSDTGRFPGEEGRVTSSVSTQQSRDGHGTTLSGDRDSDGSVASPSLSLGLPNMDLTLNVLPQALDSDHHLSGEMDLQTRSEGYNMMLAITDISQDLTDSVSQHSINRHSGSSLQFVLQNTSSQSTIAESGQLSHQRQPVALPIGNGVSDKDSTSVSSPTVVGAPSSSSEYCQDKLMVSLNHTDMCQDNLGEISNSRRLNEVDFSEDGPRNDSRRRTNSSLMEGHVRLFGESAGAGGDCGVTDLLKGEGHVHDGTTSCGVDLSTTQTSSNTNNVRVFADGAGLAYGKGKSAGGVPAVDGRANMQPTLRNGDSHPSVHRNSTPHGGACTSARHTHQGCLNRLASRPISPLAVSARNSHNHSTTSTQCQSTQHGRGREHMQHIQGRDHGNQSLPQGRGQANQSYQHGRGRNNEQHPRGIGSRCDPIQHVGGRGVPDWERQDITGRGGGSQTPAQNGVNVNSSRMRYSQPKQEAPRLQHRIKQDLEAMNFAISGMDSQTTAASFNYPMKSQNSVTGGWPADQRGGASRHHRGEQPSQQHNPLQQNQQKISRFHQAKQQRSRMQQTQRTVLTQNQHSTASQQNRTTDPNNPSRTFTSSSAACTFKTTTTTDQPGAPTQNHFCPVIPATMAGYQLSSSPRQSGEDSPSFTRAPFTPQLQSTVVNREQQSSNQGYHPHVRNARQSSHAATGHNTMTTNGPQPPQVTADSYDYLPPYSLPLPAPTLNAPTQQQQQHGRNGARFSLGSYPEPPPSYDAIFGSNGLTFPSNQTRRETRDGRNVRDLDRSREQCSQTRFRHRGRVYSSPSNSSTATSTTGRPLGLGRLTSITNLFRRTPRVSHSEAEHHLVGVEDYTAEWVASYSHTPRPHTSQHLPSTNATSRNSPTNTSHQHHHQNRNRASHNPPQRSSSASAMVEYGTANCPIPYVNPPPFPSADHTHQIDGPLTSGHSVVTVGPSNMNVSMTCLPTLNSSESQRSQVTSRDRPRPYSAYFTSECRVIQFPDSSASQMSAPTAVATLCLNNTSMTASCTNISSEEKVKSPSGGLKRRGSERIPRRRWFAYLKHAQRVPDQNTRSQQQPSRIPAPTGDKSQPEAKCPPIPGGPEITTPQSRGSSNNPQVLPPAGTSIDSPPHIPRGTNHKASNPTFPKSPGGYQVRTNSIIPPTAAAASVHSSTNMSQNNTRVTTRGEGTATTNSTSPTAREGGAVDTSGGVIPAVSSQAHSSSSSIDSSVVNSHSSRSAVRLRAEARRSLLTSSSEEDLLNELSQNTSTHSRPRMRRQRSQGSNSLVSGSQRSQESNFQGEHHVEVREEAVLGGEEDVEEIGAMAWQDELMEGGQSDGSDIRAVEEDGAQLDGGDVLSRQKESSQDIIDVNLLSVVDSSHGHVPGKSCGHECRGVGGALCCVCGKREERGITSTTDTITNDQCPLCARRLNSTQEVFDSHNLNTEMDIATSDHLNMKVNSISHQDHSCTSSQRTQYSSNKNCSVM